MTAAKLQLLRLLSVMVELAKLKLDSFHHGLEHDFGLKKASFETKPIIP